jgi:hypothetical protein
MYCYTLGASVHIDVQYLRIYHRFYIVLNHQNVSCNDIYQEPLSSFRWVKEMLMKLRMLNDPGLSLHQRDLALISTEDDRKGYSQYGNKQEIKEYNKTFFSFLYLDPEQTGLPQVEYARS